MFEPKQTDPDKPSDFFSAQRVSVKIYDCRPQACIDKIVRWTWGWIQRTRPGRFYVVIAEEESSDPKPGYSQCATAYPQRKYFLHRVELHPEWFNLPEPGQYEALIHELYHYTLAEVQDVVIDDARGAERFARVTRACEGVVTQLARSYALAYYPEDLGAPKESEEATAPTEAPPESGEATTATEALAEP